MTHEKKMKALVEAGIILTARERLERDTPNPTTQLRRIDAATAHDTAAANARDTIALAAEIVKAAGEYRACEDRAKHYPDGTDYPDDYHEKQDHLDALLARWNKEPRRVAR